MSVRSSKEKPRRFIGLQPRLLAAIILAFGFPFVCMLVMAFYVNTGLFEIKEKAVATYGQTNHSLQKAHDITQKVFKLSILRKAESLAQTVDLIVSLRSLKEKDLVLDEELKGLVKTSRVGEESNVTIIDPVKGIVILDKHLEYGAKLEESMHAVHQLMLDRNYWNILKDLQANPTLSGSVGTINTLVEKPEANAAGMGLEAAQTKSLFIVVTPIGHSRYSLVISASMGGLTQTALEEVRGSLDNIHTTLADIDGKSQKMETTSMTMIGLVALIGLILLLLLFHMTKAQILNPMEELRETAESIRNGDYERRVNLSGMEGDMLELGQTLNRMLDTITELIQSEEDKKHLQENIIRLLNLVSKAADGDLSERGPVTGDILGSVADAFNMMLDGLSKLIIQVKDSVQRISLSANAIMDASRKIATDANRQGREIHHVTTAVSQTARNMQRVSISAELANNESQKATGAAGDGALRVEDTIQSMQRIRSNVQTTAKTIKSLGDRSLEINAIAELINDISARTNILSLNASIEASKAGEQGKGFAVVADEIRKLAERTTGATKEISSLIEDIQIETNDAILAMEEVTREVELGWKHSDQAGISLRQIQGVIDGAAEKIMEIASVSRIMVTQMDDVVEEIRSIHQVARDTTEGVYLTAREVKNLMLPLEKLHTLMAGIRLMARFDSGRESRLAFSADEVALPEMDETLKPESQISAGRDRKNGDK